MRKVIALSGIFLLSAGAALAGKYATRANSYYVNSDTPTTCRHPGILPAKCSPLAIGPACTVLIGGSYEQRHYQDAGCTVPYYMPNN